MVTLNAETENVALNAKQKMNNSSKRQTKKVVALMSKWKCGSERQTEDAALNAKIKMWLWTPNKKTMIWMSKWKCGSERQKENEQRL